MLAKKELNKIGYNDFEDWNSHDNHIYIGRNMNFYVPGTFHSKWHNPYSVKKYDLQTSLKMYEDKIRSNLELYNSLEELDNKTLGYFNNKVVKIG